MDPRVLQDLSRSGLEPSDINARLSQLNDFTEADGYFIPYYTRDNTPHPTLLRKRYFTAREDGARYWQPPASESVPAIFPYFQPKVNWSTVRDMPEKWIVEGEKKAAAAYKHLGLPAIGVAGCFMWHEPDGETDTLYRSLHSEIAALIKPKDIVNIVFDGDFRTNRNVEHAIAELCIALNELGAVPKVVVLPPKEGLDDWIVRTKATRADFDALERRNPVEFAESFGSLLHRAGPRIVTNADGVPIRASWNSALLMSTDPFFRNGMYYDTFLDSWFTRIGTEGWRREFTQLADDDVAVVVAKYITRISNSLAPLPLIREAMQVLSRSPLFQRNPLQDWLNGLSWDHEPRLEHFFHKVMGAEDTDLNREIGRAWFVGLVARALRPGCKNDTMLILEGKQGIGKTTALSILGGEWYHETSTPMDSKDFLQEVARAWILDLSELGSFRRSDMGHVKALLSKTEDTYRGSYARLVETRPRRGVIVGTTNNSEYLTDTTGNRRYWPIRCGKIDRDLLVQVKDQLFAEAVWRFKMGEDWHDLGEAGKFLIMQQEERMAFHPWHDLIAEYASNTGRLQRAKTSKGVAYCITTMEIFKFLHLDSIHQTDHNAKIVAAALRQLGYERTKIRRQQMLETSAPVDNVHTLEAKDEDGSRFYAFLRYPTEFELPVATVLPMTKEKF